MTGLFICFFVAGASAQIEWGLRAGGNYSSSRHAWPGIYPYSVPWTTTFHAGLSMSYYFNERLSLQSELLFNQKGNVKLNLYYLSVPIMMNYHFKNISTGAGLYYSFLLKEKPDASYTLYNRPRKISDLGLSVQVGYTLSARLALSFRYEHGITNLIAKDALFANIIYLEAVSDPNLVVPTISEMGYNERNRNFQLSLIVLLMKKAG